MKLYQLLFVLAIIPSLHAGSCTGGTLTTATGAITDGSGSYTNRASCDWDITAPLNECGMTKHLRFFADYISLEPRYDHLNINCGPESSAYWDHHRSGQYTEVSFECLANHALVRFRSDDAVGKEGFHVSYECVDDLISITAPSQNDVVLRNELVTFEWDTSNPVDIRLYTDNYEVVHTIGTDIDGGTYDWRVLTDLPLGDYIVIFTQVSQPTNTFAKVSISVSDMASCSVHDANVPAVYPPVFDLTVLFETGSGDEHNRTFLHIETDVPLYRGGGYLLSVGHRPDDEFMIGTVNLEDAIPPLSSKTEGDLGTNNWDAPTNADQWLSNVESGNFPQWNSFGVFDANKQTDCVMKLNATIELTNDPPEYQGILAYNYTALNDEVSTEIFSGSVNLAMYAETVSGGLSSSVMEVPFSFIRTSVSDVSGETVQMESFTRIARWNIGCVPELIVQMYFDDIQYGVSNIISNNEEWSVVAFSRPSPTATQEVVFRYHGVTNYIAQHHLSFNASLVVCTETECQEMDPHDIALTHIEDPFDVNEQTITFHQYCAAMSCYATGSGHPDSLRESVYLYNEIPLQIEEQAPTTISIVEGDDIYALIVSRANPALWRMEIKSLFAVAREDGLTISMMEDFSLTDDGVDMLTEMDDEEVGLTGAATMTLLHITYRIDMYATLAEMDMQRTFDLVIELFHSDINEPMRRPRGDEFVVYIAPYLGMDQGWIYTGVFHLEATSTCNGLTDGECDSDGAAGLAMFLLLVCSLALF